MNVLLLTRYNRLGASSRLRSFQYITYLRSNGINITTQPLFNDNYLIQLYNKKISKFLVVIAYLQRIKTLFLTNKFDLIWIEKEALPWLPSIIELSFMAKKIPFIVDYDDALFHRYDKNKSFIIRSLIGNKIYNIMKKSSLVIAGNNYLASHAKKADASRIELLPTVIDITKYTPKLKNSSYLITIGWIGSPYTVKYIKTISPILKEIVQIYDVEINIIGANPEKIYDVPVNIIPWQEATEIQEIQKFDIGIMPLPDEPFERGKCGYKLIQYMACSIPVVASPVGVNCEIVKNGTNGFLASTNEEWKTFLVKLIESEQLRQNLGASGRKLIEDKYCIQKTAPKLLSLLHEVQSTHMTTINR